jgi:hypothetical protein
VHLPVSAAKYVQPRIQNRTKYMNGLHKTVFTIILVFVVFFQAAVAGEHVASKKGVEITVDGNTFDFHNENGFAVEVTYVLDGEDGSITVEAHDSETVSSSEENPHIRILKVVPENN